MQKTNKQTVNVCIYKTILKHLLLPLENMDAAIFEDKKAQQILSYDGAYSHPQTFLLYIC